MSEPEADLLNSIEPSGPEGSWSLYLHRRVMRLLLMHDQKVFHGSFRVFYAESTLPKIPLLQLYDRYLKLVTLSDELLDDILPRIHRQLSLQTTYTFLQEEAPTRGNINWQRTFERNLRQSPGMPPVRFDTQLRQRDMATPENVLVVTILLTYRQTLQAALQEEFDDEALNVQERQTLVELDERIERELASPYAYALLETAWQEDIEMLIEQVSPKLRPGVGPYRDLIAWWEQFRDLRIGRAWEGRNLILASRRSDENAIAWLYELWIVLEIIHFLHSMGAIQTSDVDVEADRLQFIFEWGKRRFRFRYNRQLESRTPQALGWQHAPSVRPDYTIEREDPLKICHNGSLIWREPAVILDAKYYLTGSDPVNAHGAIKKMLGDMRLLDVQYGALFFPLLSEPSEGQEETRTITQQTPLTQERSSTKTMIRLYRLVPGMEFDLLQARLRAILIYATEQLPEREPLACHGVWLDSDSINASQSTVTTYNVLCPKRHIGPDAFLLVNDREHCLKDPYRCHVIGQPIMPPIVIRATSLNDVQEQSSNIRTRNDDLLTKAEQVEDEEEAEQLRSQILTGIGRTVEQFVQLRGNTKSIEAEFERWTFEDYWKRHSRSLAEETRNILLSGEFVWQEYEQTDLIDWAAPAVQYCRALEAEIKRRLYDHYPKQYILSKTNPHLTLGSMVFIYNNRKSGDAQHNWRIFLSLVQLSKSDVNDFTTMMQRLATERVDKYRNLLAHGDPVSREIAQSLRNSILGKKNQPGILPWLAEHLEPV